MPLIEGLEITTLAAEGKALGRYNDIVVFVPMTVPGDIVDVQIRRRRRRYMEGTVVRYVKKSPMRAEPFCEHFGVCGGCKWQNIPYGEQLKFKQEQVADQLVRIGKLDIPAIMPIIGSQETVFYRNKLEFTFAPRRWMTYEEIAAGGEIEPGPALGFHVPEMFDKVLDIHKCWLQGDPSNSIRLEVKRFCMTGGMVGGMVGGNDGRGTNDVINCDVIPVGGEIGIEINDKDDREKYCGAEGEAGDENSYPFYNIREHTGLMRNLIVRTSSTGEVMVIVVFAYDDREKITALMEHLRISFPGITSLMYIVNTKLNDSIGDQEAICYHGRDHIFEQMEGLRFKIGAKSFYQTNSAQAYELYKVAREFAALSGGEVVYDLYTGTGTIANFVAGRCAKVVGVEYVPEAIEDARYNSALNGIGNTVFYAGDMKDILDDDFIAENGRPDVVILDPPRAGLHEDVVKTILRAAPERIIYVSCNPATQARDISLMAGDYRVAAVQPVDMFPHTHHVENVVKLERNAIR